MQTAPPAHNTRARLVIPLALGCAVASGLLLHVVSTRAHAAAVVALVVPWGVGITLLARGSTSLRTVLLCALAARLVQVGAPPHLSDDLFRYLFEGQALNAGHNPFLQAPATLASLDPALAARVNHPDIPSIYPPFAQLWFRGLALLGSTAVVAQLATALVDIGNAALLHTWCRRDDRPTWPALVYALHPLPVLESAHGAHLEPLAMFCGLATLLLFRQRPRLAAGWATIGIGVKLLPVFFIPALARRLGARDALFAALVGALVLVGAAAPLLAAGSSLFDAFGTYTRHWSFNGLLFPWLDPWTTPHTRRWLAVLGGLVVLRATLEKEPVRAWWWVGSGFLALSPTVHPWYVLWAFVPDLALGRRGWALAAVGLQSSYLVLATLDAEGAWQVPGWLQPLTWGAALAGLAYVRRLAPPTNP